MHYRPDPERRRARETGSQGLDLPGGGSQLHRQPDRPTAVVLMTRVARWNGSRWASFSFPGELRTHAAAVFSRTDVLAFGEIFSVSLASSRPYVARFTGRRWLRVPSPLVSQAASALAPDDIWTVGTLTGPGQVWAAAH
jgi:hypothetical protein